MQSTTFETPVSVSIGFGSRLEINSLMGIHQFLTDWPPSRRTSVYSTAVRACEAARQGHLTPEQARRAFAEFAKVHDILWPEIDAAVAEMAMRGRHNNHV